MKTSSTTTTTTTTKARTRVLHGVNCEITSGHSLAILGGSGSGKTTTLNILAACKVDGTIGGTLSVNGVVIKQGSAEAELYRSSLGYVHQDDRLIEYLTVRQTIFHAARMRLPLPITNEQILEVVDEVISELGLKDCENTLVGGPNSKVRGISGGERRRVSVAVELVGFPRILCLDEMTSGLDSISAAQLMRVVLRLPHSPMRSLKQFGRVFNFNPIVIFSIHQPSAEIYHMFDKVMVLVKGRRVIFGHAQLALQEAMNRCGLSVSDLIMANKIQNNNNNNNTDNDNNNKRSNNNASPNSTTAGVYNYQPTATTDNNNQAVTTTAGGRMTHRKREETKSIVSIASNVSPRTPYTSSFPAVVGNNNNNNNANHNHERSGSIEYLLSNSNNNLPKNTTTPAANNTTNNDDGDESSEAAAILRGSPTFNQLYGNNANNNNSTESSYVNPAELLLQVAQKVYVIVMEELHTQQQQQQQQTSSSNVPSVVQQQQQTAPSLAGEQEYLLYNNANNSRLTAESANMINTNTGGKNVNSSNYSPRHNEDNDVDQEQQQQHQVDVLQITAALNRFYPPFWYQLLFLMRRSLDSFVGMFSLTASHMLAAVFLSLLFSFLYRNEGTDLSGTEDKAGMITFLLLIVAFSSLSCLELLVSERRTFASDYDRGLYGVIPYFIVKMVFDFIPHRILPTAILAVAAYFPMGLRLDDGGIHFVLFVFILLLFAIWNVAMCTSVGLIAGGDFGTAALVCSLMILWNTAFGGLMITPASIPSMFKWCRYFSPQYFAYEAAIVNDLSGRSCLFNPVSSNAQQESGGVKVPVECTEFILNLGLDPNAFARDVVSLVGGAVAWLIIAVLLMKAVALWRYSQ